MIHLRARLLPDATTAEELDKTLAEFTRCCEWVHGRAPAELTAVEDLRQGYYEPLRRETVLRAAHCHTVMSFVAAYRKATGEFASVEGPIAPQKLVFYSQALSIDGRRACILLMGNGEGAHGRSLIPFDLPKVEDYQTLKACAFKRADLHKSDAGWHLDLQLVPSELSFAGGEISFEG